MEPWNIWRAWLISRAHMKPIPYLAVLAAVVSSMPCSRVEAGLGAPANNPDVTLFELPGGQHLTTGYDLRNTLTLWARGRKKWSIDAQGTPINEFEAGQTLRLLDARTFVLCGLSSIDVRDLSTGKRRFLAPLTQSMVDVNAQMNDFALSPDETRLALCGFQEEGGVPKGRLRLFDARSGKVLQSYVPPGVASEVKWLSDSRLLLTYLDDEARDPATSPKLTQQIDAAPAPPYTPPSATRPARRTQRSRAGKRTTKRSRSRR